MGSKNLKSELIKMYGKKVLNNLYWHIDLSADQPHEFQARITEAEIFSGLKAGVDYNIVKYDLNSRMLSLLWYPHFFIHPFPALETSYRIDLDAERVEKRSYETSINPPILHRKELFISANDPRIELFKELTNSAEQLGLFDDTIHIGFKQSWENQIVEKGFQLIDHQFVPIGNDEANFEAIELNHNKNKISRHLTALSRSNLSAPMQSLARHGYLDGSLTVFDYGCGKGDDIRNLMANDILVSGSDPHYAPDQPKQEADIVNIGFVINVIENYQERLDALLGAYALSRHVLVVSAMLQQFSLWKKYKINRLQTCFAIFKFVACSPCFIETK